MDNKRDHQRSQGEDGKKNPAKSKQHDRNWQQDLQPCDGFLIIY